MTWPVTGLGPGGTPRRPNRPTTTWPSSSAASSSPPDFAAHALSRPPRKKPGPSSPPGPPPGRDQQKPRNTRWPVGAENRGTAADLGVQGQRSAPAVTVLGPRSMIFRRGLPTCVPDPHPSAELAGAARPLRRRQGRGDPRPPPRSHRAAPTPPAPEADLAGPRHPLRVDQTAPTPAAPAAARLTPDSAALARPTGRPPLDLPATAGPTTRRATRTDTGTADG